MHIGKIISGGQTGADTAALNFAKDNGIPTGGFAPRGFMTELGPNENLKSVYGLVEIEEGSESRTIRNIMESDGTIIFADKLTDGSNLTLLTCIKRRKPHLYNPSIEEFREWIKENNIKILNIAGNRESVTPGIEKRVYKFLTEAFSLQD
jgi:hypothetical protein